jgi:hypothetical protein
LTTPGHRAMHVSNSTADKHGCMSLGHTLRRRSQQAPEL